MALNDTSAFLLRSFLSQTREYAVICVDPDGVVLEWLGAAREIFGYEPEDIIGSKGSQLFTAEDREKGLDRLELDIARKDSRSEDDRWHVRKDGTRIWVTGAVSAIRDSGGRVVGFVKVLRDRTDVRIQLDSLENQNAKLHEAMERTHTFLRTLGHELRNPLAPLQSASQIIQKVNSDPRAEKALQIIFSQIATLKRMADDLMNVSRLDVGKVQLDLERVDLRDLVRNACAGYEDLARDKGVDLASVLPQGRLEVRVDLGRFQQVTSNLLGNAIKYTPPGGKVWMKATQQGDEVVLRIEDTGIGIAPDMLPKLFELFSRGDSAQEIAPSGLGIGLAVVQQVMELHGGTVQARSAGLGKGAVFTVRLPAAEPA